MIKFKDGKTSDWIIIGGHRYFFYLGPKNDRVMIMPETGLLLLDEEYLWFENLDEAEDFLKRSIQAGKILDERKDKPYWG